MKRVHHIFFPIQKRSFFSSKSEGSAPFSKKVEEMETWDEHQPSYALFVNATRVDSPNPKLAYFLLMCTVFCECAGTFALRLAVSNGAWFFPAICLYVMSFAVFSRVLTTLPLGLAYSVWSGSGCIVSFVSSVVYFGEELSLHKVVGVCMILLGIVVMTA